MKKSELKDYIKEQIIDVLSEASSEDVENQKAYNDELEKTSNLMSKMDMKEEDEEPTKAQLKKGAGSLSRLGYQLADLTKEMKDLVKKFKSAEGEEKEKIKDKLKTMTTKKKDLEAKIEKG